MAPVDSGRYSSKYELAGRIKNEDARQRSANQRDQVNAELSTTPGILHELLRWKKT